MIKMSADYTPDTASPFLTRIATHPRQLDPEISVVIPVFNEAESLPRLAVELRAALDETARSYEVLLVDDRSTDGSYRAIQTIVEVNSHFRLFRLAQHRGQSTALAAGFRQARGEIVVTLDSDLQNDPADIPQLLAALEGCDLVSGIRVQRRDSWPRRVSSRLANRVRGRVLADGVTDVGCSLKAYRKELLRHLPTFDGMHRFLPALAQIEGARVREIEVRHRPRRHGETKYNIRNRLWRGLADLMAVRWMQRKWIDHRQLETEVTEWKQQPSG